MVPLDPTAERSVAERDAQEYRDRTRVRRQRRLAIVFFVVTTPVLGYALLRLAETGSTVCEYWEERVADLGQADLPCKWVEEGEATELRWSSSGTLTRLRSHGNEIGCGWWVRPWAPKMPTLELSVDGEALDRATLEARRVMDPGYQEQRRNETLSDGGRAEILAQDFDGDGVYEQLLRDEFDAQGRPTRRVATDDGEVFSETHWIRGERDRLRTASMRHATTTPNSAGLACPHR